MVTLDLSSILSLVSLTFGSFCLGALSGVWHQRRTSADEAHLLVGIWERVHELDQKVESCVGDGEIVRELCADVDTIHRRLDDLEEDVSLFYKEDSDSITLELPLDEIEKASHKIRDRNS